MKYCPICGGTGVLLDGTPCPCQQNEDDIYSGADCLSIPETYRGVAFNSILLPKNMGTYYAKFMQDTYDMLTSLRWRNKNIIICSPAQTGKSVLAYTVVQSLFKKGLDVFPLMDILEIKRVMQDIEYNRSTSLGVENPQILLTTPYLFAYIPASLTYDVFDTAAVLVSRRVRRGNSTILLYQGNWNYLASADTKGSLKNMAGSGALTTVEVHNFTYKNDN